MREIRDAEGEAARIHLLLSDLGLFLDPRMRIACRDQQSIPISNLTPVDEVRVARALRKLPDLRLSDDGRQVGRKNGEIPDTSRKDAVSVVVECGGESGPLKQALEQEIGPVEALHQHPDRFYFIAILRALPSGKLMRKLQIQGREYRMHWKPDWESLCMEYYGLSRINNISLDRSGSTKTATYEPGVIAKFCNIQPHSSSKHLKVRLLEHLQFAYILGNRL